VFEKDFPKFVFVVLLLNFVIKVPLSENDKRQSVIDALIKNNFVSLFKVRVIF